MKVLYDWLKEFVDVTLSPEQVRDRLSLSGTAVEGLEQTPAGPLLDAELTINRPDCLGHYGMAREVAALERKQLRPVEVKLVETAEQAATAAKVQINCPDLCSRYTARVLRGVKVQPSPDWLRRRLEALGQSSINNVVDATNYVMLELGHPMHAFDLDRLSEHRIVVRRARAGEKMRTLDGIERSLTPDMCMIADATKSVAVGGVMGGAESEISSATRNILLESAWFDPISVRRTSKALNLRTEASTRFERGADLEMAEKASQRCAALIHELAGGEILSGVIDVYPGRRETQHIELSRRELLRLMGSDVPDGEIEAILGSLGFEPSRHSWGGDAVWHCMQPSWRQDVSREVDLIEEVARHHGFDKFPPRLHASRQPSARLPHAEAEDRLRERLIGLGYREIVSIPLVNADEDALFRPDGLEPALVGNPLAEDASVLRSTGLVTMAQTLAWNLNRGQRNVRLFEIGRAYAMKDGAPQETRILTLGATGLAREKSVTETPREFVFADLKGDLDQLGELAAGFTWNPPSADWQNPAHAADIALAHGWFAETLGGAGTTTRLFPGGPSIGSAAQIAQRAADVFKLRQASFLAQIALDSFFVVSREARAARRYKPISRFPAIERDFALVVADGTPFGAVRDSIADLGIAEISSIEALDLYRGKNVPSGKFSLLVRVTFLSQEATLTEPQVNDFSGTILASLEQRLGAALRTS